MYIFPLCYILILDYVDIMGVAVIGIDRVIRVHIMWE